MDSARSCCRSATVTRSVGTPPSAWLGHSASIIGHGQTGTETKETRAKREAAHGPDPVVALGPAKTAAQSVAALLRDFKKAHAEGMAALEKQDFDALGDAIRRERELIETQSEMIERSTGKRSTRRK